ncbi:MAG: hypothetical protein IPG08_04505 [Sphingobacteriaceae bacterium]|nr:hypothetical protein [Sphingobacteriaceae bacterium]
MIHYWAKLFPEKLTDENAVNVGIINSLIELINAEGKEMPGLRDVLEILKSHHLKVGLCTSSDHILIDAVLKN